LPSCRTNAPSRVLARKRASTSAPSTASHAFLSRRQRRRACAGVSRNPGISRYSPRIRRTTSCRLRLDSLIGPPATRRKTPYAIDGDSHRMPTGCRLDIVGSGRNSGPSTGRVAWLVKPSAVHAVIHFAFDFRRAAQYFFIRSDTALRAAADMLRRRRLPLVAPPGAACRLPNRSGNARQMAASSRRSSSRRALAPSLASRCSSLRLKSATDPP